MGEGVAIMLDYSRGGMRHTSTALYFYGASKKSLHSLQSIVWCITKIVDTVPRTILEKTNLCEVEVLIHKVCHSRYVVDLKEVNKQCGPS